MRKLAIEYRSPAALKPRASNPRTHTPKQIAQIARSIEAFGFTTPILIDETGGVIAGHGCLAAAKQLGLPSVPTIRLSEMSPAQIRAYVIADNKLALNAGWDTELLALELQGLLELGIDVTLTGFETPEIDVLIGDLTAAGDDPADDVPPVREGPAVTRRRSRVVPRAGAAGPIARARATTKPGGMGALGLRGLGHFVELPAALPDL